MDISPFGEINPSALDEYYDGEILVFGKSVEIDANFESEEIEENKIKNISSFLNNIEHEAKKAFDEITKDWDLGEESETARFYLDHHINELTTKEVMSIFGKTNVDKDSYLNSLQLVRIGLYPEDEESFAIFDIQFPEEYTNYLMAVTFNDEGELSYISMDS